MPNTTASPSSPPSEHQLSMPTVVGIVVGCLAAVVIVAFTFSRQRQVPGKRGLLGGNHISGLQRQQPLLGGSDADDDAGTAGGATSIEGYTTSMLHTGSAVPNTGVASTSGPEGMQNTSAFANTSADGLGSSAPPSSAEAPAPAQQPAARAEFGSAGGTGFPRNEAAKKQVMHEWAGTGAGAASVLAGPLTKVRRLEYAELSKATDGFSELCRIGGGGSCVVYRAQVRHTQQPYSYSHSLTHQRCAGRAQVFGFLVAVKRLTEGASDWDTRQFEAEYSTLCKVTHPSVCRLFAFSTDGPNRCLLLELCSGGALDTRLRCLAVSAGAAPPAPLQWRHRLRIALDIARALAHLHSQEPPILHRDMKV
jgi:hypothetical protein